MKFNLHQGDCLDVMRTMEANSVDAIVTDPPYGLSFMGKDWDHGIPGKPFWEQALRVAKPGAHLLAFGGTRTFHRLACAIQDAGWEIRDTIMWVYGSGFPKSHDISKALDKMAGAERDVVGTRTDGRGASPQKMNNHGPGDTGIGHADGSKQIYDITAPFTDAAKQWEGYGTALKPAYEPIILARKPLTGTVAENVLEHGVGGLNVGACRVASVGDVGKRIGLKTDIRSGGFHAGNDKPKVHSEFHEHPAGRYPSNLILDGSPEVVALFPVTTSGGAAVGGHTRRESLHDTENGWGMRHSGDAGHLYGDSGSAARFFYCAKASKEDRDEGLDGFMEKRSEYRPNEPEDGYGGNGLSARLHNSNTRKNHHPTVKPTSLMQYLCRLITPPNGIILDPFMGSGSTGKAAMLEGFRFVGIEREAEYLEIARARIEHAARRQKKGNLLEFVAKAETAERSPGPRMVQARLI